MSVSFRTLAAVFEALSKETKIRTLSESFEELGVEHDAFLRLSNRYKAAREFAYPCGRNDLVFASWLVARVGPSLNMSTPEFEAIVVDCAGGRLDDLLVAPKWLLGEPVEGALQRRMPCKPFVQGDDEDMFRAYDGLLQHLHYVGKLGASEQALELLNTSIPWRIVALADRLEPAADERDSITYRLGKLRARTVGDGRTTAVERGWWDSLDGALIARRHVLSHLGEKDGWTFTRCVDQMWPLQTALEATAGIGLSVMARIAASVVDDGPPVPAFNAVMEETSWLDEHLLEGSS